MMQSILPVFRSHYSQSLSLLTLAEPGKAKPGNPISVFDLVQEGGLKDVVISDTRIDGFIEAYKTASKLGLRLCYGIQLVCCADCADRSMESRRTESRVIVFIRGGSINEASLPQGYSDLLRIWSRAWGREGHVTFRFGGEEHAYGRTDWKTLKALWTPNLVLALPYVGSFIARNTLSFNRLTADLPVTPWLMKERMSGLPYASILDEAIDLYATQTGAPVMSTKTICYKDRAAFEPYVTLRALGAGGTWEDPNVDHLCSDTWCWEVYRELTAAADGSVQKAAAS